MCDGWKSQAPAASCRRPCLGLRTRKGLSGISDIQSIGKVNKVHRPQWVDPGETKVASWGRQPQGKRPGKYHAAALQVRWQRVPRCLHPGTQTRGRLFQKTERGPQVGTTQRQRGWAPLGGGLGCRWAASWRPELVPPAPVNQGDEFRWGRRLTGSRVESLGLHFPFLKSGDTYGSD